MYHFLNFLINYIIASFALIILSPLLLIIILVIFFTDTSVSPIIKQERVGRNYKNFSIYKLRTMRKNNGSLITKKNDNRITSLGKFLRKSKLDELPQLINILKNEMYLVGPRPETPNFISYYKDIKTILSVRPGLTDLYSIKYFDETEHFQDLSEKNYINNIIPIKNECYINYISKRNLKLDIKIIITTIKHLIISILRYKLK